MCSMPLGAIFTNSGIFTARFAAVAFSIRIAGVSFPCSSICVKYICVYGDLLFDENTSQRPFGEKLCHEFISAVLQFIRRAVPPAAGTIYNWLSGRISCPFFACTNTIHFPSGENFGKLLLIPFWLAPSIRSGVPPLPPLKGIR